MAVSPAVWEIRPGGNNQNGGLFDSALGGVDYSLQDSPQLTLTDGGCDTGTTTFTSVTGGFTAAMVGNGIGVVQGGTFRGYWKITVFTDTNTVTVDRVGPVTATNHTFMVGGALLISDAGFPMISTPPTGGIPGNKIWVKGPGAAAGDYTATTNNPTLGAGAATTITAPVTVEGYTTTRGDGGRPTIAASAAAIDAMTISGNFFILKNLSLIVSSGAFRAIVVSGAYNQIVNCVMSGVSPCRVTNGSNHFIGCEMKDGSSTNPGVIIVASGNNVFDKCAIHGNGGHGVNNGTAGINYFLNCAIYGNSLDGVHFPALQDNGFHIYNCNIWNNGSDGVEVAGSAAAGPFFNSTIHRCVFGKHAAGYDINYSIGDVSTAQGMIEWAETGLDCNAFYTTGLGKMHFLPANSGDITLTESPFDSDTDFDLNSASGGGALIVACTTTLPDGNTISSLIGASSIPITTSSASLRTLWREYTGELNTAVPDDDVVDIYIQGGLEALNRRVHYHYTTATTGITLVAAQQEYSLPSDCVEVMWVEHNGVRLTKRDVDDWNKREEDWRGRAGGTPTEWAHEGDRIIFSPPPNAAAVSADATPTFRYVSTPGNFTTVGALQLNTQSTRLAVVYGAYLWAVAHPDSALAVQRAQGFLQVFSTEAAAVLEEYRARRLMS